MNSRCSASNLDNESTQQCGTADKNERKRCFSWIKPRGIGSKGAVLLILCNVLFQIEEMCSVKVYTFALVVEDVVYFGLAFFNIVHVLTMLYPVMGYIADTKTGRYRLILISQTVRLVGSVISGIGYNVYLILDYGNWGRAMMYTGLMLTSLGNAGYSANIVPFIIDQMNGASGDQLNSAMRWFYVGILMAQIVAEVLAYFMYLPYLARVLTPLLCVCCLAVGLDLMQRFDRYLDTNPQTDNPVKTTIQVLNYARKHKHYSRNRRSAFTYFDEVAPSRLDFAKIAYGGVFSEEVVEDVKTMLRLTPIVICICVGGLLSNPYNFYLHFDEVLRHFLLVSWSDFFLYKNGFLTQFIPLLVLITYEVILHRYVSHYVPRLLKQIRFGIICVIASIFFFFTVDTVGHLMSTEHIECYFNVCWNGWPNSTGIPISRKWIVLSKFTDAGVTLFLTIPSLEFIVAQSPARIRGLMVGLWYAFGGFLQLVNKNSLFVFLFVQPLREAVPSCMTHYYITKLLLVLAMFLLFLILAHKYQMRQREVVVNIHNIAEDHHERYIQQEEDYRRELDLSSISSSSSYSDSMSENN